MSNLETPMIEKYWRQAGGTLIEEFLTVKRTDKNSQRLIDAVIIKNGENRRVQRGEKVSFEGKGIICVQAKTKRLGMNLMGK
jgi:ribosomal protein L14